MDVAKSVGQSKLWDLTPELGLKTMSGLLMLSRALGHHSAGPLQEIRLIHHIVEKHWRELHLLEIGAAERQSCTMLNNSQIEVLPKFKNISNTYLLLLCSVTATFLTHPPSNRTVCLECVCFLKSLVTVLMYLSYYSVYTCPLGLYDEH